MPALLDLAHACLDTDGGLPLLGEESFVHRLFFGGESIGGWDMTGELVAAAALFLDGEGRRTGTGLTHPQVRAEGYGADLVAWGSDRPDAPRRILAETTSPEQEALLASAGFTRVFAEHVMRHRSREVAKVPLPEGLVKYPFTEDSAQAFHTAYRLSFAERPGYPDTPFDRWVASLVEDPDFLPEESRVAIDGQGNPAGFVTVSTGWIDQVGVVPAHRGRGLGAHLVVRSVAAVRRVGEREVWLAVNVDNTHAHELYLRLGFRDRGLRARYAALEPTEDTPAP